MLLKQLSALRFLLRQGIAVHGHIEAESNLFQLLLEKSSDVRELRKCRNYLSHDIINEQIQLLAHQVLRGIIDNVQSSKWFSIMADE